MNIKDLKEHLIDGKELNEISEFSLKLDNAYGYSGAFSILGSVFNRAIFLLNDESLTIMSMDASHASLFRLVIPKERFVQFEVSQPFKVSFDVPDICRIFSMIRKDDSVMISQSGDSKIMFLIKGEVEKEATINIMAEAERSITYPSLEFDCVFDISSKELKEQIRKCTKLSESIIFTTSDETLTITVGESLAFRNKVAFAKAGTNYAKYSSYYLNKFVTAKISDKIRISYKDDYPMVLSYGALDIVLAPRVES